MSNVILITGAHRSGSTWTGKIISSVQGVKYVHEPFNIGIEKYKGPLRFWFEYIDDTTDENYKKIMSNYIASFYKISAKALLHQAKRIHSAGDGYRFLLDVWERFNSDKVVLKDPIAVMSADWIYNTFNSKVIINIRHPAAFVASLKVKGWEFDFRNLIDQQKLISTALFEFKEEIEYFVKEPQPIISQGVLLWKVIYTKVLQYREKYLDVWYFVRHEDLSLHPLYEFEKIFNYLNLDFSDEVKDIVIDTSTSKKQTKLKRNSALNVHSWKQRLSPDEIKYIKEKTSPLWERFYNEEDWT